MIGWLIIGCEIGFWVFVLAGLVARYILKKKKLGAFLLICTPVVDLVLLAATVLDLKNGATATMVHGIAAIYIGISIAFGHGMIKWADQHFAYRFANGEKPPKKIKYGTEHARREREGWFRHLLAWIIGASFLGAIILYINNGQQTEQLLKTLQLWTLVLGIDFLISFSYTLFPKKGQNAGRGM
ncbi:hypothetical protein [Bacillus sp. UMB0893]|uniref:hypothetical protein n=1 Tax=Bacillus sp. UMB0893 TaxID=2066053 RepID=UPI000C76B0F5|nr:hypothetical protein [Bacillus sp. UMB0893]PLR69148.1 hypothetical protein CYJ36_01410 [Bacillus sp. UMB0893]QNG59386.1 hypothetical protein H4O14_16540 [Bacillus sp. PAMC26568]